MSESRIARYAAEQRLQNAGAVQVSALEAEIEAAERQEMRLRSELMEETRLRVQAEKRAEKAQAEVQNLTVQLEEAEKKLNAPRGSRKRTGKDGQRVSPGRSVSPVSKQGKRGAPSKRKGVAESAGNGGTKPENPPAMARKSARKRGTAK